MTEQEIQEILDHLNDGNFKVECPSCQKEMDLNQTGLFYLNNFSSEAKLIYKKMLEEQKKRRANLKSEKENISVASQRGASENLFCFQNS